MAADKPGDITYSTELAKPEIAVITNIGEAHMAAFGTRENLIKEKTNLLKALPLDGLAILNFDDEVLRESPQLGSFRITSYAIENLADVTAKNITTEINNYEPLTQMQIIIGQTKFLVKTHTLGKIANVYPVLATIAIARELEITQSQIFEGLQNLRTEKHRLDVVKGKAGAVILDDCYNASPLSMKAALDVLKNLSSDRKVAVLGDMRELGNISEEAHKIIGEYAHAICDEVLGIGEAARGYKADKHFDSKQELVDYLLKDIKQGDIILVKASRGAGKKSFLEDVVLALKE
jgi:UDP-N-acetylmuramoyl-tripeptide--D-alanyl-D-alanine ligase